MIGYIDSSSFPVYTYGEMTVVTPYHIRWTPSNISSGTFSIDGSTYNFSDYNGEFYFDKNYITSSAFISNQNITTIDTDVVALNQYAFAYCYNLSEISLSKVTTLGYRAFFSCYALSSVYLPECKTIAGQVFGWCSGLTSISLPKCEALYNRALYNTAISEIYLPVCSNISSQAFYNCTYLNTISLGSSSVCRLFSSDAFAGTGITSSTGTIIVPSSLYEAYRTDSVWSYFFYRINPKSSFYVKWWPSNISSGTFTMEGSTYNFSNYSGIFWFSGGAITSGAFSSARWITSIETDAYIIEKSAFNHCSRLGFVSASECYYVGSDAFNYCSRLETIYFPECRIIGSAAFYRCSIDSYNYYDFPKCSVISGSAFAHNDIIRLTLSGLSIEDDAFAFNSNLSRATIGGDCSLGFGVFYGCDILQEVTMFGSEVCYIQGSNTFQETPMFSFGSVYVPSSLVSAYKSAKGWSYFRIYPINN